MKVYLAGQYSHSKLLKLVRENLQYHGHTVTSRWLDSSLNEPELCARRDLEDINACEILAVATDTLGGGRNRGGRYVEFGYALGKQKICCIIGDATNVFTFLPEVVHFPTWLQFEQSALLGKKL